MEVKNKCLELFSSEQWAACFWCCKTRTYLSSLKLWFVRRKNLATKKNYSESLTGTERKFEKPQIFFPFHERISCFIKPSLPKKKKKNPGGLQAYILLCKSSVTFWPNFEHPLDLSTWCLTSLSDRAVYKLESFTRFCLIDVRKLFLLQISERSSHSRLIWIGEIMTIVLCNSSWFFILHACGTPRKFFLIRT